MAFTPTRPGLGAAHASVATRPWGAALRPYQGALVAVLGLVAVAARAAEAPPLAGPGVAVARVLAPKPGSLIARESDLNLVWYDPSLTLPSGFLLVSQEVERIFDRLGVRVAWRVGGTYGEGEIPEIPIIALPKDPRRARQADRIMGLVVRNQEPGRAVWVFLEAIRATIEEPLASEVDPEATRATARAVARVVAHEVVHAVAPDEPHAFQGLMRHALDRGFLLGRDARIDPRCASALVARLASQRHVRSAPRPTRLSAALP